MNTIISALFFLFFLSAPGFSQVNPEWVTNYNGLGTLLSLDKSHAICGDLSGNIYVTGESYGSTNNLDYLTVKINPDGDTVWTRRYNGSADSLDIATDIAVDHFGNVYVTGRSINITTGWDITTVKYNTLGDLQWISTYNAPNTGSPSLDQARSICVDALGNCYVTGISRLFVNGTSDDMLTIKYNSSGTEEWVKRYNGPLNQVDQAYRVKVDDLGNVYVVGFVDAISTLGTRDYCTIKYNSSGVQQWLARYDGPDKKMDEARLVDIDGSGYIYVSGISISNTTYIDYLTIKYDTAGVEQWTSRYSYSSLAKEDTPRDMVVDDAGNCYITGIARSDQNWAGFETVKYNSSGIEQWATRYDLWHTEDPYGIALDSYGNIYVSGESNGDVYTIAYNSLGSEIWSSRFTNPGLSQEYVSGIVVDTFSTGSIQIYVSGSSENAFQDANYIILKYSSITGISEKYQDMITTFYLDQNYPNPFNPSTKIRFTIPASSLNPFSKGEGTLVSLKVFDVLGNEVATLVNEEKPAGVYEVEFSTGSFGNASNLSSGVYFYKISAGSFNETKKMILLR